MHPGTLHAEPQDPRAFGFEQFLGKPGDPYLRLRALVGHDQKAAPPGFGVSVQFNPQMRVACDCDVELPEDGRGSVQILELAGKLIVADKRLETCAPLD